MISIDMLVHSKCVAVKLMSVSELCRMLQTIMLRELTGVCEGWGFILEAGCQNAASP